MRNGGNILEGTFFALVLVLLLFYIHCRRNVAAMLERPRINSVLYPNYYCMPPRWMRKHFGLDKKLMPKYIYHRMWSAIIWLCLLILSPLIFVLALFYDDIGNIPIDVVAYGFLIDTVVWYIEYAVFSRKL